MGMKKVYDCAVKTGSYTNAQGEEKGRWENIGAIMQGDDGSQVLFLKRHFNPAGISVDPGRDSILISLFEPKQRDGGYQQERQQPQQAPQRDQSFNDDIPF